MRNRIDIHALTSQVLARRAEAFIANHFSPISDNRMWTGLVSDKYESEVRGIQKIATSAVNPTISASPMRVSAELSLMQAMH